MSLGVNQGMDSEMLRVDTNRLQKENNVFNAGYGFIREKLLLVVLNIKEKVERTEL